MPKKIIAFLLLILPMTVVAESCEFTTFSQITNTFQDSIHNQFGEPGPRHSADFWIYEPNWSITQTMADHSMPENLREIYGRYRETYERLDKIYAKDQTDSAVRAEYSCQQKFYTEEILNAFLPGATGLVAPNCDRNVSLDPETRLSLRRELSSENLRTCQFEEAPADDPANFAIEPDRASTLEQLDPGLLSFNRTFFDLTVDQVNRLKNQNRPTQNTTEASSSDEDSTEGWWSRFSSFFGLGEQESTYGSVPSLGRVSNFLNTRETDVATRARRAAFENRRNFWIQRGVTSGQLLDAYDTRFEEEMLETLEEANESLDDSLKAIEVVCREQRTEVKCWDGKNKVPTKKLWAPFQSFN